MSIPGLTLPLSYDSVGYAKVGNCYVTMRDYTRYGGQKQWIVLDAGGGHPHDPDNDFGNLHVGGPVYSELEAQQIALESYKEWLQQQLDEMGAAPYAAD